MNTQFVNFNLHISKPGKDNKIEIQAKDDSGNVQAKSTGKLIIDQYILSSLENNLGKNAKQSSESIKKFGHELYSTIFSGEILGYYNSLTKSKNDIRLKLIFSEDDPELHRLPWEFIYDGNKFLAAYPELTMTRVIDGISPEAKEPIQDKLRVLVVVSSPLDLKDHERLQAEQEQILIMQALDRANSENKIDIDFLDEASLKEIQAKLDEEEYHIIHYSGHGAYSDSDHKGYLILEDDSGKARGVDNETVARLFSGHKSLRLVVLSGCQTAKTSGRQAFSDMATPLLRKNIPAVIAMQYSVTDKSAMTLARKFYSEIGNGAAVDMALTRARKTLQLDDGFGQVEFGTPVIFSNDLDCLEVQAAETKPSESGFGFQRPIEIKRNIVLGIEQLGRQFIGRRKELRRVKDDFRQGKRVVILHGIGGIGKTVTVAKIAEKLQSDFNGIYTFDCREDISPEKILMQLNDFLKANGVDTLDQVATAQAPIDVKLNGLAQVLSQVKLLLVFDNFETQLTSDKDARDIANPDLKKGLKDLIRQCVDGSRFLFTSRYTFDLIEKRMTNLIDEINLGEMSQPEAVMIMNRFPDIAKEEFSTKLKIFNKIGGHPYTINIFGKQAAETSPQDVLTSLEGVTGEMVEFTLIDKSYEKLGDPAKKLLNQSAVLKKSISLQGLEWLMKTDDETPDLTKDIEELTHWGLIIKLDEEEDTRFQVHTLVKDFIKSQTDGGQWIKWQIKAAEYYEELFNTTKSVWDYLDAWDLYFEAKQFEKAAGIALQTVSHLTRWGFIEMSHFLNRQTVETTAGVSKGAALHNLGYLHFIRGDYEKAKARYNECLKIAEVLGDKSYITITLHQLGWIHQNKGEYDEAKTIFTNNIKVFNKLNDWANVAASLHHLGMIHQDQGHFNKAIARFNESLGLKEKIGDKLGKASDLHHLGMIHQKQGDYDSAIDKYNESLKISEEFGDKLGIASSLTQLGRMHINKDEFKQALEKYLISASIFDQLKSQNLQTVLGFINELKQKIGEETFKKYYKEITQNQGGETDEQK